MKVLIQAGGKGTRLQSITGNLPKPMVRIGSKPILEWQIASLVSSGLTDITIVVAPTQNVIQEYFGDGSKFGATIHYLVEKEPLGTGGILCEAKDLLNDDFVLLFGDLMLDVDWQRMVSFHEEHKAAITTFAHPNSHPFDSDLLIADKDDRVTSLDSKHNVRNYYYENLTNAGIYIVSKTVLESIEGHGSKDFEKDILVPQIAKGNVWAYRSSEYVKDCGTPDRYEAVNRDCASGIIAKKCLRNKQKAIFLDRDGTLNVFGDFVVKAEMLFLMNDAPEAVKDINKSDYLVICITNQPVVARGETTLEELRRIHNRLEDLLGQEGAYLDDLYFCPHHPDSGFKGEVSEFKIVCDCRKPKIGMLLKAQKRYNIDLTQSWFIGDTKQDVQTGINGGCQTVLLTCGDPNPDKKYREARPTFVSDSLLRAVQKILKIN
jgi:mannose-1-phosphate guanylyltransferase / phosphomannomutase